MIGSARARSTEARKLRADHILDVASDLLLRWGYARVTIDDISRHAGVGKGTVYLHWATREDLFYSVVMREQLSAVEEQLAALRRDVTEVQVHRLVRWKYFTVMRRPILRAILQADPEILGHLVEFAKGSDLVRLLGTVSTDYFQALIDHGLLRDDLSMPDLLFEMGAMTMGFFTAGTYMAVFGADPDLERKADLLEDAIRRSFALPPNEEALRAVAPMVIELFEKSREMCIEYLKQSYDAPAPRTGEPS
jgi:AcrR family transcriptional regulator